MKVFLVILGAILYAGIGMFMDMVMGWSDPIVYYGVGAFTGVVLLAIDVVEGE